MSPTSVTVSGLSQWVVCDSIPYEIEIVRETPQADWTVQVTDAVDRATIWKGSSDCDAHALLDAINLIHGRHAERQIPDNVVQLRAS
ncbi:hypothetical protein [Pseudoruegeria sp. HB172150]|uniref:hypothetical protein n=1 Tax=Pseudoruegeria sp. HB172150 TaxID=2721164 RepID=UPI0015539F01|nr:hypothetical protein [Pseudoruegeria sp. HB172150]